MAKVVDKWKTKRWYDVVAPEWFFDGQKIGEVIASEDDKLIGRKVEIKLSDLIGMKNISAIYKNLYFRITKVNSKTAFTDFIGYAISPSFIKTFSRRRKTLFHEVIDATTKDGRKVRTKLVIVANARASENTRRNFRNALKEKVQTLVPELTYAEYMNDLISGKVSATLIESLKHIVPIHALEVRKVELKE